MKTLSCPVCNKPLRKGEYKGIETDVCEQCSGVWLDLNELDQVEDKVFDNDAMKNTLVTNPHASEKKCPVCGKQMTAFSYRWDELELDCCKEHGFWLDATEIEKVPELLTKYVSDLQRKELAEEDWTATVRYLRSPSFLNKLKELWK